MKCLLPLLAFFAATAAEAQNNVTLNNQVFVEHVRVDAQGRRNVVLDPPGVVTPGDHLVFVLTYRNGGQQPATGFAVTNPIPPAVAFERSDDAGAMVSVDGGRTWGALAALTVAQPDGSRRPAVAADVTHVRWAFSQPIPAGAEGRLSFRGIVK
jgi:uncharacterized repeat protein (TIGR01451 family)